uniref:Uncharacterized protein n=1 Tax=Eutreptiella gymnastica TaxID=73025 RepID=A0A7S4CF60_9EUGL
MMNDMVQGRCIGFLFPFLRIHPRCTHAPMHPCTHAPRDAPMVSFFRPPTQHPTPVPRRTAAGMHRQGDAPATTIGGADVWWQTKMKEQGKINKLHVEDTLTDCS